MSRPQDPARPGGPAEVAVQPDAITDSGRAAGDLAAALSTVRSGWATATDRPGDALGYRETARVFTAAHDLWFEELGVHIRLLQELCQGIQTAATDYHGADAGSARDLA